MTFEIGTDPSHVEQHPRDGTGERALADRFGEFAIADDDTLDTDREVAADSVHATVQALSEAMSNPSSIEAMNAPRSPSPGATDNDR